MKKTNLVRVLLCFSFIFLGVSMANAQVDDDPCQTANCHIVVKGSSTDGAQASECIAADEGGSYTLEFLLTIANLNEVINDIYAIPTDCPPIYLRTSVDGAVVDLAGPISQFTFHEMFMFSESPTPLYTTTVNIPIPRLSICGQVSEDDYVSNRSIYIELLAKVGTNTYAPYTYTISTGGQGPVNPYEGCDAETLYPSDVFTDDAGLDFVELDLHFCCAGVADPTAPVDPFGDPEDPFIPGEEPAENRTAATGTDLGAIDGQTSIYVSPNPFQQNFNIQYQLSADTKVSLQLFNAAGQLLNSQQVYQAKGEQNWLIDAKDLPKGIYLGQLHTADGVQLFKVVKQ